VTNLMVIVVSEAFQLTAVVNKYY